MSTSRASPEVMALAHSGLPRKRNSKMSCPVSSQKMGLRCWNWWSLPRTNASPPSRNGASSPGKKAWNVITGDKNKATGRAGEPVNRTLSLRLGHLVNRESIVQIQIPHPPACGFGMTILSGSRVMWFTVLNLRFTHFHDSRFAIHGISRLIFPTHLTNWFSAINWWERNRSSLMTGNSSGRPP